MASLVTRLDDGREVTIPLGNRPVRIGRAATCEIVLRNDAEVSRVHAEVWLDEHGTVLVQDTSKNGTRVDEGEVFLNSRRPAQRSIRISDYEIRILNAVAGPSPDGGDGTRFLAEAPGPEARTQYFPTADRYDLNEQRLRLLMELVERLGGAFERKTLLEQALSAVCEALHFDRGLIVLRTQRGDSAEPVARNVQKDATGTYMVSRKIINPALLDGKLVKVDDVSKDMAGNMSESLVRFPIHSAICAPILHRGEILGAIYGDRISQAQAYQDQDVAFLAAIAQQVGLGLANLRLFQEYVKSQKVYAQLDDARLIQQQFLPRRPLTLGGVTLEGFNQPSSIVGGDLFDYFALDGERAGIVVADVTGHGLPAALLMANLQSAFRVGLAADANLLVLAASLNRLVCANTAPGVFITAILGVLDARRGVIEYINAGHPNPLAISAERAMSPAPDAEINSLPLGIHPQETFTLQRMELGGLKAALFYTDGLSEAANPAGQLLGCDPVGALLCRLPEHDTAAILAAARAAVLQHLANVPPTDDMTLLAANFGR